MGCGSKQRGRSPTSLSTAVDQSKPKAKHAAKEANRRTISGRAAPTRRLTLAKVGTITPDEARTLAKKTRVSVAHGADPAAQRAADKRASTLAEVAEQFLTEHVEAKRPASSAGSYRDLLERLALATGPIKPTVYCGF
jgi:hypothetical protein